MDLNISDQFETLIPYSAIYFLGMRAQILQKLATGSSSRDKKRLWFSDHFTTLITSSVKYFLEVCAHFSLKVAIKDSFRYNKNRKILFLTLKL